MSPIHDSKTRNPYMVAEPAFRPTTPEPASSAQRQSATQSEASAPATTDSQSVEHSVCRKSQPVVSRAQTSCYAEKIRTEEDQSVFESTPSSSSTAVRCSEAVIEEATSQSTFENNPAKSSAAVTWETQVTEATDGQCVFENQPGRSAAHATSGGYDSEYTTDDSEDEN